MNGGKRKGEETDMNLMRTTLVGSIVFAALAALPTDDRTVHGRVERGDCDAWHGRCSKHVIEPGAHSNARLDCR